MCSAQLALDRIILTSTNNKEYSLLTASDFRSSFVFEEHFYSQEAFHHAAAWFFDGGKENQEIVKNTPRTENHRRKDIER